MNNNKTYRPGCPESQLFSLAGIMHGTDEYLLPLHRKTKMGLHYTSYLLDEAPGLTFTVQEPGISYNKDDEDGKTTDSNFEPEYRFLHLIKSHPFQCLEQIFENNRLEELQMTWRQWMECSVCTEFSAFNEGMNRKYLLRFSENFEVLMEALHYALMEWFKYKKMRIGSIVDVSDHYKHLGEKTKAYECIKRFVSEYTETQVRKYMWSILECAIDEGATFDIPRGGILFEYESLLSMVRIPYHMIKHYPTLFNKDK